MCHRHRQVHLETVLQTHRESSHSSVEDTGHGEDSGDESDGESSEDEGMRGNVCRGVRDIAVMVSAGRGRGLDAGVVVVVAGVEAVVGVGV